MSLQTQKFAFDQFVLDVREKALFRDNKAVPITPRVFQLLLVLVENHGHLVEKDVLMKEVWPNSFVEEGNLSFTIRKLRVLLNDDPQNPTFIETVPRHGYRFVANVRRLDPVLKKIDQQDKPLAENSTNVNLSPAASLMPHIGHGNTGSSSAVVALNDWRAEDRQNAPKAETMPETSNLRRAAFEIVPSSRRTQTRRPGFSYVVAALFGAVLLAGVGLAFYLSISDQSGVKPAPASKAARLTSNGKTISASVSPDGRFVAYVMEDEIENRKEYSLWLKNIPTGSDAQILPPVEKMRIGSVAFSPDGNYVFYGSFDGEKAAILQLPVLGGMPRKVLAGYGGSISFSPDGNQFAFLRYSSSGEETASIVIANADGSGERILASSKRPGLFLRSAAWSPDGKLIACAALNSAGIQEVVAVRVADGVASPVPSPEWSAVMQVAWRPDGKSFLVIAVDATSDDQIWSLSYPAGEARRVTEDSNEYRSISLPADGSSIVAVRAEHEAHLWIMSSEDPSRARQLTSGFEKLDGVYALHWTKDGRIVYENAPSGRASIWTINPDGRALKQLSAESGEPAVSPDGSILVYQTRDTEGIGLFRVSLADGEKKRLTTGTDLYATFSPDGRWIVFTRYDDDVALWKVPIDGGEAVKLTKVVSAYLYSPAVSPDGKLIAFHLGRNSRGQFPEIALIPFDGGEIVKTFDTPKQHQNLYAKNALQWTSDGQAILLTAEHDNVSNIWRQPIDGSQAVQITKFDSGLIFNFAYSPDGKQLVLSRGTFNRDVVFMGNLE